MTSKDYPLFTSHITMYNKNFSVKKFEFWVRYHFNALLFSRTSEQIVAYKLDGRICIINYSEAGNSGSLGACKITIGSSNNLRWLDNSKILVYHGSQLALLSFPDLEEIQVYRTAPIFADKMPYNPL